MAIPITSTELPTGDAFVKPRLFALLGVSGKDT